MHAFLRKSGVIAAAALLASSCAVRQPFAPPAAGTHSQTIEVKTPGMVTVPLTLPDRPERGVLYAYDRTMINTVEVRLRDSLGNEAVQYVVRNAYLAGSRNSGDIDVIFHNVMPGTFTLTVRTSHERLLSADGPVKYDGLRDVFFVDLDGDHAFDAATEDEIRVIQKSGATAATSNLLVFDDDARFAGWGFPDNLRRDTTETAAGFGIGGATQSIIPGNTTTVAVTVGQPPTWAMTMPSTVHEVVAGNPVTLSVANGRMLQASESVMVARETTGITRGIVDSEDFVEANLNVYASNTDADAGTLTFSPTRATHPDPATFPSAWPIWLLRGQAVSEPGVTLATAPRLIVHPAAVDPANSRIFGKLSNVPSGDNTALQVDLRDAWGNRVAGNIPGVNAIPLGGQRFANVGLSMDYAVHEWRIGGDPASSPFILPGRTTGTVSAAGVYTQGATAPELVSRPATYSVTLNDGNTPSDLRLSRLEIPYYLYAANEANFGAGVHTYELVVEDDPEDAGDLRWVSLRLMGGPTIASASVDLAQTLTNVNLLLNPVPPSVTPRPIPHFRNNPVVLTVPARRLDELGDGGTRFQVTDYGARSVNDRDTVRARVLQNDEELFTQDVTFGW